MGAARISLVADRCVGGGGRGEGGSPGPRCSAPAPRDTERPAPFPRGRCQRLADVGLSACPHDQGLRSFLKRLSLNDGSIRDGSQKQKQPIEIEQEKTPPLLS